MSLEPSLLRGSLGGWVASAYCLFVGLMEAAGGSYQFFGHPTSATLGAAFGLSGLILLALHWRLASNSASAGDDSGSRSSMPFQFARNLCALFALVLLALTFLTGGQPSLQDMVRLVFQLVLIWIVYSSISFLHNKKSR